MTAETIDDILQEMRAKAATLCRKGHLGAAEEWRELANRLESAILADRAERGNSEAENRKAGEATDSEKWIRAWRNRFISERTEKYRADGDGYELSRAQAEDDANNYENSLRTAMREAGEGEKG